MKEKDLFCEEHGYLGSSCWLATLQFLATQHLKDGLPHELYYQWGKEVSPSERNTVETDMAHRINSDGDV